MMECIRLASFDLIQQRRNDYLSTLATPLDGMWESAVIAQATFWDLLDGGHYAGHFCLSADNELLRFYLLDDYRPRARQIFRWVVSTHGIRQAITSTIEPLYFSCCLEGQTSITLHSFLFRDRARVEAPAMPAAVTFSRLDPSQMDDIVHFYRENTTGSGDWIEAFLHERLKRLELFGLTHRGHLIATGECIPSQTQKPYADLGVVVAQSCRGQGLGSATLVHLKHYCYQVQWIPICSCEAGNNASKRAIEKAGFISDERMLTMQFEPGTDQHPEENTDIR